MTTYEQEDGSVTVTYTALSPGGRSYTADHTLTAAQSELLDAWAERIHQVLADDLAAMTSTLERAGMPLRAAMTACTDEVVRQAQVVIPWWSREPTEGRQIYP